MSGATIFFLFSLIALVRCEPMPSGRDCYDDRNVTVPTIFCSAFLHCECTLCKRVGINSSDEYCIAQTPSLNESIWNCPAPYNQTVIDACESIHGPARSALITLYVAAAVFCVVGTAIFFLFYLRHNCNQNPYQSV